MATVFQTCIESILRIIWLKDLNILSVYLN